MSIVDCGGNGHFAAFGGVFLPVAEHVAECVADLARRLQDPVVVAGGEHAAAVALGLLRAQAMRKFLDSQDLDAPPQVAPVGAMAFAFDFLPPGDYRVALRERGQRAPGGETTTVHLTDRVTPQLDLTPASFGLGRLRGCVTRNGAPMPFVSVVLTRGTGTRLAAAVVDRCGQFEFEAVASGPVTIAVHHGERGPVLLCRRLDLKVGEDCAEDLAVAFGAISGRVIDAVEKLAQNEMRVDVLGADGTVLASARTGSDGTFRLPVVQAGQWTLAVGRLGEGVAHRQAVHVAAGSSVRVPDLLWAETATEDGPAAGRGQVEATRAKPSTSKAPPPPTAPKAKRSP